MVPRLGFSTRAKAEPRKRHSQCPPLLPASSGLIELSDDSLEKVSVCDSADEKPEEVLGEVPKDDKRLPQCAMRFLFEVAI
eukprot:11658440-Alexandrium_andersonii.AAC.1